MAFNFVGRLQLVGPTNLGQIVSQINRQLSGIRANININISPNTSARINALNTQLSGLNAQLSQVSLNAQKAQAALANLATGLNNLNSVTLKLPSSLNSSNSALSTTATVAGEASQGIKQFGEQAGLATRRFLAFSLAAGSLVGIAGFFKQGIQNAIEFERQLTRLNQVGSGTREELQGIASEISRVSTAYGSSSKDLSEVAVTLRQAGLEARDVRVALDALAQSTLSPSFGNLNNTVEGLIATFSQFKITASQSAEVLGSINAVSAGLAVEAEDITSAISKAGGAFALLANASNSPIQNLREFIAVFSSVRATTRESADTIATGLRSVFTRFQRPEVVDSLRELGINLRFTRAEAQALGNTSLENQFVGAYEAVVRLSEGLRSIPNTSSQFAAIVESLGGIRQVSRILPLLSEGGVALRQQALALSQAGASSLGDSTQKGLESLAVRGRQVYEEFQKLFRLITEDSGFQVFAKSLLILAEGLAKVLQFAKPLIPVLLTLASASIFKSLGTFGAGFAQKFVSSQGSSYYNIRGYATGGKVGGTGNKDTELAALTPGEYIIPKQAAQRIGYDNLEKMAAGGPVPPGATPLDPPNNFFYLRNGKVFNRPNSIGIGATLTSDFTSGNETAKIAQSPKFEAGSLLLTGLNQKGALSAFYNRSRNFYQNRAKEVAGRNKKIQDYLNLDNPKSPYLSVIGTEFEVYGQRLFTKEKAINTDQQLGADINTPEAPAFRNFDRVAKNLTESIDFSGSKSSQRYGKFPQAVKDYLNSLPEEQRRVYIDYSGVDLGDFKNKLGKDNDDLLKQLQTGLSYRGSNPLRKFAGGGIVPGVGNSDSFPAVLNEGDYVIKKSSAQRAGYPALQALANNKFAEGGVVPALLMPGEFVFDQKQASRIGKANLDNLNRTGETKGIQKYAYGGFVRMANGTTPLEAYLGQSSPGFRLNNPNTVQTGTALTGLEAKLRTVLKSQIDAALKTATQGQKDAILASEISNLYQLIRQQKENELQINKSQADILKRQQLNTRLEAAVVNPRTSQAAKTRAQKLLEENRERLLEAQISLPSLYAQEAELKNKTSLVTDSKGNLQGFSGQSFIPPKPPTLRERFQDPNTRLLAAQLALPFLGQAAESLGGPADGGNSGRFIAGKAVGGTLSGVATGAALGSTFGLPGAIVGGVVGGFTGLISSIQDAEKQLREVRIAAALNELKQAFSVSAREIRDSGRVSNSTASRIRTSIRTGVSENAGDFVNRQYGGFANMFTTVLPRVLRNPFNPTRALDVEASTRYEESLSRLSSRRAGAIVSGPDSGVLSDLSSRFADTLPALREAFESEIASTLRDSPTATDEALRTRLSSRFDPTALRIYSALSGGGESETELLSSGRRRSTLESVSSRDAFEFSSFARLGQTIDGLNENFARLTTTTQNFDSILSGSAQQARIAPLNLNNPLSPNFSSNIESVRSGLGLTGRVGQTFTGYGTASRVLSTDLERILRVSGGDTTRASTDISSRLTEAGVPEFIRRSISTRLTASGESGRILEPDISRRVSELISGILPPEIKQLAESYTNSQNAVIEQLNRYNNVLKQSTELGLRLNELNQQQENVRAGFEAQNRGLGSGAGVLFSRTSSDDRFRGDLRTILSGTTLGSIPGLDPASLSPSVLGRQIQIAQSGVASTTDVTERNNLLRNASAYTQALQRMADVTTRTASIQENLNRLEQSREARLNFNQRYLTADPESRVRTNRGLLLAQNAFNNGGDIGSTSLENRRLIFEALNQVGNGRLGFAGGLTGTELSRQFANDTRFGITQPPGETEQINTLQQQILAVYGQANEATIALRNVIQNDLRTSNDGLVSAQNTLRTSIEALTRALEIAPITEAAEAFGARITEFVNNIFSSSTTSEPTRPRTREERIRLGLDAIGFNSGGPVPYYASQGLMNRGRDTVPAMLTPGEYVVNAGAASRNRDLLEAINGNYLAGGGIPVGFGGMFRIIPEERTGIFGGAFRRPFEGGIATGLGGIDTAPAPIVRELSPLARRIPGFIERPDLTIGGIDDTIYGPRGPDPLRPILIDTPRPDPRRTTSRISGDYLNQQSLLEEASIGRGLRNNLYERQVASRFSENFGNGIQLNTLQQENNDLLNRRNNSGFIGATRDFSSGRRSITSSNFVSGSFFNIPGSDVNELRRRRRVLGGLRGLLPLGLAEGGPIRITREDIDNEILAMEARRASEPARTLDSDRRTRAAGFRGLDALIGAGYDEVTARRIVSPVPRVATTYTLDGVTSPIPSSTPRRTVSPLRREINLIESLMREGYTLSEARRLANPGVSGAFYNNGGPVYANNGLFVPRGTDTIPAMLSPGEYVINRRSTEQFKPLLEQINNNRFANGGPVGKIDQGFGPGVDTSGFSEASRNISRSFVDFGNSVRQLTQAIESIPTNIQLTANHRVEIIHNGVEIFSKMEPMIRDLVVGETSKQLNQFVKDKLPDLQ